MNRSAELKRNGGDMSSENELKTSEIARKAVERTKFGYKLMIHWLKINRTDVFEACMAEAAKKYPYRNRSATRIPELPKSLARLK